MLKDIACVCDFEWNYKWESCILDAFTIEEDVRVLSYHLKSEKNNAIVISYQDG